MYTSERPPQKFILKIRIILYESPSVKVNGRMGWKNEMCRGGHYVKVRSLAARQVRSLEKAHSVGIGNKKSDLVI